MKKTILLILIGAVIGGAIVFMTTRSGGPAAAAGEKPEEEKPGATHISRDEKGNVVVSMNDETQGNIGLKVEKPAAAQWQPEL